MQENQDAMKWQLKKQKGKTTGPKQQQAAEEKSHVDVLDLGQTGGDVTDV